MSLGKRIEIKETIKELQKLRKGVSDTINKRLMMLLYIKKYPDRSVAKRSLSVQLGVDANSITAWKKLYIEKGISGILSDGRIGFKPSVITAEEHEALARLLHDPQNGVTGYKELLRWVEKTLNKKMCYITLVQYVQRHFGTRIKVARKSHIRKSEEDVSAFKKTLVRSVVS